MAPSRWGWSWWWPCFPCWWATPLGTAGWSNLLVGPLCGGNFAKLFPILPTDFFQNYKPRVKSKSWSPFRYGFDTPPNYNDHESYCGGFTRQWQTNRGKCGICGDAWDEPQVNPFQSIQTTFHHFFFIYSCLHLAGSWPGYEISGAVTLPWPHHPPLFRNPPPITLCPRLEFSGRLDTRFPKKIPPRSILLFPYSIFPTWTTVTSRLEN